MGEHALLALAPALPVVACCGMLLWLQSQLVKGEPRFFIILRVGIIILRVGEGFSLYYELAKSGYDW